MKRRLIRVYFPSSTSLLSSRTVMTTPIVGGKKRVREGVRLLSIIVWQIRNGLVVCLGFCVYSG